LNLVKDSVSIFKGDVIVQVSGNSIENLQGNDIKETSYQNNKDTYNFDDFNIRSSFDEDRFAPMSTLLILLGNVESFSLLNWNLVKNSLGSLYTNFKANKVSKGQF
jgi:hypothetical protein